MLLHFHSSILWIRRENEKSIILKNKKKCHFDQNHMASPGLYLIFLVLVDVVSSLFRSKQKQQNGKFIFFKIK